MVTRVGCGREVNHAEAFTCQDVQKDSKMREYPAMRQLSEFEGVWKITRQITHADGTVARFNGAGTFVWIKSGLVYDEHGILQLEMPPTNVSGPAELGPKVTGTRRYFWDTPDDVSGTDHVPMRFSDGRAFHLVPLGGGDAAHWCDPDQYDVSYDFADWPFWSAVWRVRGPCKNYMMTSDYSR
jgi:hypothetical protein